MAPRPEGTLSVAACAVLAAACGGARYDGVDPGRLAQSWVSAVDGSALAAFLETLQRDPCGASSLARDVDGAEPALVAAVRRLVLLGEELCAYDGPGVAVARDEFGLPRAVGPENGVLRAPRATFVFDGYARELVGGGTLARVDDNDMCGGGWATEAHTVFVVGDDPAYLSAGPGVDVLRVVDVEGRVACLEAEEGETLQAALEPGASPWTIQAVTFSSGSERAELRLAEPRLDGGAHFTWRVGEQVVRDVNIGPYVRDADDIASWCSGFIRDTPDFVVRVPYPAWGYVSVESSADPVLVIRHEDGTVECNDDYNGLNPAIDMYFAAGTMEVWVGSFGSSSVFDATITFH